MDGYGHDDDAPDPISSHSLLLTSSLVNTGNCSSPCIADESKTSQPVFTHNEFYTLPDFKMTLPPTAYTSLSVSPLLTSLDLKHHPHHHPYVYDDCPNGWKFDDNIINNNVTTNEFYTPPDIKMTLPPTAYTPLPVSPLLTSLDLKYHTYHPPCVYDDCPDGWKFDDYIINKNITITANNSQPSIFFDDKLIENSMILVWNLYLISK